MFGLFNKTQQPTTQKFDLWKGNSIVTEQICPDRRGRVKFRGSWWFAQCVTGINVSPGVRVNVIGRNEMTLLVEMPKTIDL